MSTTVAAPVHPSSPESAALLARIAEGTEERERTQTRPHEVIDWLRDAGFGRLRIPVKEGGAGLSVQELLAALIALAEADSNVAHILRVYFAFVEQQLVDPDASSRALWLELVNRGAIIGNAQSEQNDKAVAGRGLETQAVPDPDGAGYRLTGVKYYSTGSLYADYIWVFAAAPDDRLAAIVVPADREGVEIVDDWDGFGQRLRARARRGSPTCTSRPTNTRTGARPAIRYPRR